MPLAHFTNLDLHPTNLRDAQHVINALVEENARLKLLAYTDSLTGLMNRLAIIDWIEREISRGDNLEAAALRKTHHGTKSLAIVAIDLIHFKQINDTLGHAKGDEALVHAARAIRRTVRLSDIVGIGKKDIMAARPGGDEFVVVLRNTDVDGAKIAIERILKAIREFGHSLDARAGCVIWEHPTSATAKALMEAADHNERTLKTEKRAGSLVTLFKP